MVACVSHGLATTHANLTNPVYLMSEQSNVYRHQLPVMRSKNMYKANIKPYIFIVESA